MDRRGHVQHLIVVVSCVRVPCSAAVVDSGAVCCVEASWVAVVQGRHGDDEEEDDYFL